MSERITHVLRACRALDLRESKKRPGQSRANIPDRSLGKPRRFLREALPPRRRCPANLPLQPRRLRMAPARRRLQAVVSLLPTCELLQIHRVGGQARGTCRAAALQFRKRLKDGTTEPRRGWRDNGFLIPRERPGVADEGCEQKRLVLDHVRRISLSRPRKFDRLFEVDRSDHVLLKLLVRRDRHGCAPYVPGRSCRNLLSRTGKKLFFKSLKKMHGAISVRGVFVDRVHDQGADDFVRLASREASSVDTQRCLTKLRISGIEESMTA
jgi:hypothetical protein